MSDRRAKPAMADPTASSDPPVTKVVVTSGSSASAPSSRAAGPAAPIGWMLAAVALAWLGGHLGESRFAVLVGGDGLEVSRDLGLASGIRMLVDMPGAVVDLARLDPISFGLGFLLLVIPVAGLVAARPDAARSGGVTALAAAGATVAAIVFLGMLLWLGGTTRGDVLAAGLLDSKQFPEWIGRLERIAGGDWMMTLAAAAWTALAFRLPLPRWSSVGAGSLGLLTTFACWYGGCATLGTLGQFDRPRPMAFTGTSDAAREPVLGTLAGRPVAMSGGDFPGLHTMGDGRVAFSSPQSLREFLTPSVD